MKPTPQFKSATARAWVEQRRTPRRACAGAVFVRLIDKLESEIYRGDLVDLSATGAGIILPLPLPVSTLMHLAFVCLEKFGQSYACTVRNVQSAPIQGMWRIGCEFLSPLDTQDVETILSFLLAEEKKHLPQMKPAGF